MRLDQLLLSVIAASPNHQIEGKKRVHKTLYLAKFAGEQVPANFYIKHFGVFSDELAETLAFLSTFSYLDAAETRVGANSYFATVFQNSSPQNHPCSARLKSIVDLLSHETTPVLEVASTIAYFEKAGLNEKSAEQKTKDMKPAIANAANIKSSRNLLANLRVAHA